MLSREDVINCMSEGDRRWIARCQMLAVVLLLALLAGVVLWPLLVQGGATAYDAPGRSLSAEPAAAPGAPGSDQAEAP